MIKKNGVIIESKAVCGVIHPLVEIYCSFEGDEKPIFFEYKGKTITPKKIILSPKNHKCVLKANLPKDVKKINVVLEEDGKKIILTSLRNNIVLRSYNKVTHTYVANAGKKVKKVGGSLYVNTKYLWKEYHFMPPKELRPQLKEDYKRKIRLALNKEKYNPYKVSDYNKWLKTNEEKPVYEELKYKPLFQY